jgi:putative resolvase
MPKYLSRKDAAEKLGIHYHTIYALAKRGELEATKIGKQQMYNVDKYLKDKGIKEGDKRRKICYCRVSSNKQKADLKRQIEYMEGKYPGYEIISDIASGLNYEREGLKKLMEYAIKGEISVLIIAYKDRLTRFGYEMIEWLIKEYSNGEIVIINKKEEETPLEEVSKDIISIMNVYTAKINGLRKYKKLITDDINQNK